LEVWVNLRIDYAPRVPRFDALRQNIQMLLIRHIGQQPYRMARGNLHTSMRSFYNQPVWATT
jgi:hypothetical protein